MTDPTPADGTEIELDVRPLRKPDKHPRIFATFDELPLGSSFVLVNNHNPLHLHDQFEDLHPGGYGWDYVESGPAQWRIRITKLAATTGPSIIDPAEGRRSLGLVDS